MLKTVKISDVTPERNRYHMQTINVDEFWDRSLNGYRYSGDKAPKQYVQQYSINNGSANLGGGNPFFTAFLMAYNQHEDVVLSPDDVWFTICQSVSKYVNDNAEAVRKLFVDHDGKKKLTVVEPIGKEETDWDDFFKQMTSLIGQNVKGDTVKTLVSSFSTTGKVESILSYASIMDTFKKYFDYGRCIPCCGIRNVHFMGTLEDWMMLKEKTVDLYRIFDAKKLLGMFSTNEFTKYLDGLVPVLDQFVNTYKGNVDTKFWDQVVHVERERLGSGGTSYYTGWLLNFFYGFTGKRIESSDIDIKTLQVDVELENRNTGLKKMCKVVGGFYGVNYANNSYRPQMSLAVFEDTQSVKPLS